MSREYPAGTVVCIASNPDVPLTVIATPSNFTFSKVMWFDKELQEHYAELHDNTIKKYKDKEVT